jgi:hypothetical protein
MKKNIFCCGREEGREMGLCGREEEGGAGEGEEPKRDGQCGGGG